MKIIKASNVYRDAIFCEDHVILNASDEEITQLKQALITMQAWQNAVKDCFSHPEGDADFDVFSFTINDDKSVEAIWKSGASG
jgi:hypothetical protein